ncbi:inverse autotransporter beta-barrel domain-containing protein [Xenorhabdus beddingii]|uniref:Inverse autotransporter beta-barrel domain-containing protein n=1 Tax=Xenorhabdus beddingii TaxID=40578 RepID=A0A1Y2SM00_9GAMM|nr:inverse autotransporter beta-barrel domain-containing protein [Xenorhabdus beddingii]
MASVEGIKTPQSVDVEFVPPPVDFEIASVEVYAVEIGGSEKPFDKTKPLLGNGVDKYKYRALMTKKGSNGKDPIKNHLFSGVVWTRDQTQIDDKYLPQPEETSSKTDNQGYLYATLGSHVGVGKDIEVTLQIPTQKGGKQIGKTDQNNLVRFDPVPQQAVMHAYNINREKEVYQTFKEPHPYNFFISLATKLRSAAKPNSDFNTSELTYNFIATDPPENPYMVNFGKDNKGPITFQQYGKGVIQALINKSNGVIELYEYKLNVGRALAFMGGKELYYSAKDHHSCETINSVSIQSTPYIDDFQSNYKGVAINNEFNNLYEWGLFGNDEQIKNNLKIKIRDSSRDYIIYDANKHKIDYSYVPKGMIVCIK